MGENPLMSEPNLAHARHAVEHLEFFVAQDILFNETNVYADVILPAASFAEKDGTFTNSDRRVQHVRQASPPPGQGLANWEILANLARRTMAKDERRKTKDEGPRTDNPDALGHWSLVLRLLVLPRNQRHLGRDAPGDARLRRHQLRAARTRGWRPLALSNARSPWYAVPLRRRLPTARGKFWPVEYATASELPDADYPFILDTGRVLYHWHGGTMTRVSALDAAWPECTVEMHSRDAARLGLASGDWVDVASRRGTITARLLVTDRSPKGMIFIPFHFAEAAANVLTDNRLDPRAKIPDYKVCAVRVTTATAAPDRPGAATPLTERGAIKDPVTR